MPICVQDVSLQQGPFGQADTSVIHHHAHSPDGSNPKCATAEQWGRARERFPSTRESLHSIWGDLGLPDPYLITLGAAVTEAGTLPGRARAFFTRFRLPIVVAAAVFPLLGNPLAVAGAALLTKMAAKAAVNKVGDAVAQAMVGNDPLHGLQV